MTSNTYRGRKHPSSGVLLSSHQDCTVFLTVVTLHRRCWLASPTTQKLLHQTWEETTHWLVGTYLLMPDHLHMFCAPRKHNGDIETWIRYWKRLFRQNHQREEWKFQAHGWHHRLRHDESREANGATSPRTPSAKASLAIRQIGPIKE
jgi:putative transposase